jgi:ATP-dependent helicase HrpB
MGALVLDESTAKLSDEDITVGFQAAVEQYGLAILNWTPSAILLRARLAWLFARCPSQSSDMTDAALCARLDDWLLPALYGVKSIGDVDVANALLNMLDWPLKQSLGTHAPEHFETPAGTRHVIDYSSERGPTVEVRVQEVFGLTSHPRLADRQVALVFQLLSPAHRPIAVTSDLPSFWRGAWAEVRKDMRARYPRHVWPEDPSVAIATTRAKPRGT